MPYSSAPAIQLQERRGAVLREFQDHKEQVKRAFSRKQTFLWTSGSGKAPWEQSQQLPDSQGSSGSSKSWGGDCCCLLLTKGAVNKGMLLRGTIATDGVFTGGVYFLLEDLLGDLVKVGVYNTGVCDQEGAKRYFSKGRHIAIREPFLKLGSTDGLPFIRIDDPREIQASSSPCPGDAAGWHAAGNALWRKHDAKPSPGALEAASLCWQKSVEEDRLAASVLLSNRAQAHINAARHAFAARDALAAWLLDGANVKAKHRLSSALQSLGEGTVSEQPECWWEERPKVVGAIQGLDDKGRDVLVADGKGELKEAWSSFKEQGNVAFRDKQWDAAAQCYSQAIEALLRDSDGRLAKVMCNLSLASCLAGDANSALKCATAAVVVSPNGERAWLRRAQALEACGMTDSAASVCTDKGTGGAHAGVFKQILQRVTAKKEAKGRPSSGGMDTDAMRLIRAEFYTRTGNSSKGCASVDQQEAMASMIQAMKLMCPDIDQKMFGRRIDRLEDFRVEVPRVLGGWPAGVDSKAAEQYLREAWVMSVDLPHMFELAYKRPEFQADQRDLLKRVNGNANRMEWLFSEKPLGDVYVDKGGLIYASSIMRHDFTNQPYRAEVLLKGTTHVAVGFVDLGMLLVGQLHDKPGRNAAAGPLVFCGYEACAFNCAKSAVLWQLLSQPSIKDKSAAAECVAQVWFSSTWTRETAGAFAVAVGQARKLYPHGDVAAILDHWAASPGVLLSKARERWLGTDVKDVGRSSIVHLKDPRDRGALASYELTGDFCLGGKTPQCGSVCWWDCPEGTPLSARDQSALGVLDLKELAAARVGQFDQSNVISKSRKRMGASAETEAMINMFNRERSPASGSARPASTFVQAAEQCILAHVLELMHNSKDIRVKIVHSRVEDAVHEIASMRPWSISWSNILDYMSPTTFHKLARQLSVHGDVVHHGYSMNWVFAVKGAQFVDYMLCEGNKEMAAVRAAMIEDANTAYSELYEALLGSDWDKILRWPPPQNPMNTVNDILSTVHFQAWVDSFFQAAEDSGPSPSIGKVAAPALSNPFSCYGASSIHMAWTYDKDIVFNWG